MRTLTYYSPQYISDVATPECKIVFGASPYHLEEVTGLGAPDINMVQQGLPLQNGAQFSRLQYQPRMITISGKVTGTITTQNTAKGVISKALAYNNLAVRETWQADFWRLRPSDSGIDTSAEFIDFLFNTGGLGVLKYTSDGITVTKRINAVPYAGPHFKNKDGREPYQEFQIVFICPYPFWEDDEYTLLIDEMDNEITVDFEVEGDVPPRSVLYVEPQSSTVSNSLELTINGKQNYTPGIATSAYVPTMIDLKSTASLKDGDTYFQSFARGELQSYINRSGNALAVAVGYLSPYIATSTDGLNWSAATSVVGTSWFGVDYSPQLGRFVAVGSATPYIATSTDGQTWTAATTVVGTNWRNVKWIPELNRFVAIGQAAPYIATSADGLTWAAATTVVGTGWIDICWSKQLGRCVITGNATPYIATSTDGLNWSSATTVVGTGRGGLAWSSSLGLFIAVSSVSPYIIYSYDGLNWDDNTVGNTMANPTYAAWSQSLGRFVVVGISSPYIVTSIDGINWSPATTVVGTTWQGVEWISSIGRFAVVGGSPYIATSTDGLNWAGATTIVGNGWYKIASFPDTDDPIDTNSKLIRFKAIDMPPGEYRATMKAQQVMVWKMYYRKSWMGI